MNHSKSRMVLFHAGGRTIGLRAQWVASHQPQPSANTSQGCAEAAGDAAAEKARLQATVKADRRLREQHAAMLAALKSAKQQAEAEAAARSSLQGEVTSLQAKVRLHACTCVLQAGTVLSGSRAAAWVLCEPQPLTLRKRRGITGSSLTIWGILGSLGVRKGGAGVFGCIHRLLTAPERFNTC